MDRPTHKQIVSSMDQQIAEDLEKFDITNNGFLSSQPIEKLKNPAYRAWEDLVDSLPVLNKENTTGIKINEINDFDLSLLTKPHEFKRAYVILSMITNSYIFCDNQNIAQTIPVKLAKPLCDTADYLGINPILTHAAVDLYNWYLMDPNGPIELDNLRSKNLMTGTEDEERFYLTMVAIEKIGSNVIHSIMRILYISNDTSFDIMCKTNKIGSELVVIKESIVKMISVIKRLREKCRPDFFYNNLRPFLSGWKNNEKIPNGILYEGISDDRKFYYGGSAAQSSLFQVLDAAFDIVHDDKYFEAIRNYMPKKHREFIEFVKTNISIKKLICEYDADGSNSGLYQNCLTNLMIFRGCHMNIVKEYILSQIPKECSGVTGTGGTNLITFLNDTIKTTQKAIHE